LLEAFSNPHYRKQSGEAHWPAKSRHLFELAAKQTKYKLLIRQAC